MKQKTMMAIGMAVALVLCAITANAETITSTNAITFNKDVLVPKLNATTSVLAPTLKATTTVNTLRLAATGDITGVNLNATTSGLIPKIFINGYAINRTTANGASAVRFYPTTAPTGGNTGNGYVELRVNTDYNMTGIIMQTQGTGFNRYVLQAFEPRAGFPNGLGFYSDNGKNFFPQTGNAYDMGTASLDWHEIFARHFTDSGAEEIEAEIIASGKRAVDFELSIKPDGKLDTTKAPISVFEDKTIPIYERPNSEDKGRIINTETKTTVDIGEGVVLAQLQITELKAEIAKLEQRIQALEKP